MQRHLTTASPPGRASGEGTSRRHWLRTYWRWLLAPRRNRRRQLVTLGLLACGLAVVTGIGVWAAVAERWGWAILALVALVDAALSAAEDLTRQDLRELGVPQKVKPSELARGLPPGSVTHRTAVRAARLYTAVRLVTLVLCSGGLILQL